jgi:hypothetical protein
VKCFSLSSLIAKDTYRPGKKDAACSQDPNKDDVGMNMKSQAKPLVHSPKIEVHGI